MPFMLGEDMTGRRSRILVVDDNEANRALAKATLEDDDYDVVLAEDGATALALFESAPPDCVVLDVRMPGLDGFAVCERIRALPTGADTPVLFLTAARDVDTFDRALRAGGDDFLTKPVRPTELVVRVQSALELRRVRSELREQYGLLKRQRDDLLRLQLQKERLTAFLVHDLKNPVNTMDLHAQLLLRDKTSSPSVRESATLLRTEARRLTKMIVNLLDLSKADEGQLAPKRATVDLRALVSDVLNEDTVSADARDVRLESVIDVETVEADADLLLRTVGNLVENAIRYAPAGTTVTVSACRAADGTEIRVVDRGRGIPAAEKERIFDAFAQLGLDTAPSSRNSRGLGLSFCKSAVEAHGGRIWVEDASPGTMFCLTVPHAEG